MEVFFADPLGFAFWKSFLCSSNTSFTRLVSSLAISESLSLILSRSPWRCLCTFLPSFLKSLFFLLAAANTTEVFGIANIYLLLIFKPCHSSRLTLSLHPRTFCIIVVDCLCFFFGVFNHMNIPHFTGSHRAARHFELAESFGRWDSAYLDNCRHLVRYSCWTFYF